MPRRAIVHLAQSASLGSRSDVRPPAVVAHPLPAGRRSGHEPVYNAATRPSGSPGENAHMDLLFWQWMMMGLPAFLIQFAIQVAAIVVGLVIWDRFLRR